MFRKFLSVLLVICTLLTCSAMAETKYPLVDEPITIKGVCFGGNEADLVLWDYMAKLTGITVEWQVVSWDQKQVFIMMNEWPDFFANNFTASDMEEWGVQAGWLLNLNDYMEYMPNLAKTYEDYPTARKMSTMSNGAIYSFPNITVGATASNARWHYNYGILDELGLEIPTTADEYFDVLMAIKEATGEAPLHDGYKPVHGYYSWAPGEAWNYAIWGTDTNPNFHDDGTGKVEYGRIHDQYRYHLQFANKLYENGLLHQEYLTMDGSTKKSRIQAGKTVFASDFSAMSDVSMFKNGWSDLRVLAPLTSQYDDTQTLVASPVENITGAVINAKSPYVKEICQMFDIFYATSEVAEGTGLYGLAGTYGPENVTWRYMNEEKTEWEYICPPGYEDVFEPTVAFSEQYVKTASNIGRTDDGYFHAAINGPMGNSRARAEAYVANLNPYQEDTLFPQGKMAMTAEENEIILLYESELRAHVDEWTAWFITGKKDIDNDADWNEYVEKCYGMHLQELIDAYQSAYDRYQGL